MPTLEITAARDRIVTAVHEHGCVIITAPPGTGKSTQVPLFFRDEPGTVIVLQPRRIAARGLAAYVSRQLGEDVGGTVGYRVRFDSRTGKRTKIIFQTYGVFIRQLLNDPFGAGASLVILDEFHERTLETDLVLAWLKRLQQDVPKRAPGFIVMSATLEADSLGAYLDPAEIINVPAKAYPVEVKHLPSEPGERLPEHAVRALSLVLEQENDGSVLIFMPGAGEIRRTMQLAEAICRKRGVALMELHGSLPLKRQSAVLERAERERCVIVSTNVAETSLTIPGVTCVIDGGKERRAAYDHIQDRNTLHLHAISKGSAVQRTGRAGRTAPGICIRLWSREHERKMEPVVPPEIARLELSQMVLQVAGLLAKANIDPVGASMVDFIDAPGGDRWEHALGVLVETGAFNKECNITSYGVGMLEMPVRPLAAALLLAGQAAECGLLSAAVIALWETDAERKSGGAVNLFTRGMQLISDGDEGHETTGALKQLCGLLDTDAGTRERAVVRNTKTKDERQRLLKQLADAWLPLLHRYIAVREGTAGRYVFTGGKPAMLPERSDGPTHRPDALLGLGTLETGGGVRARQGSITAYIPLESRWIVEVYHDKTIKQTRIEWSPQRKAAVALETIILDGLELLQHEVPAADSAPEQTARLLAEHLLASIDSFLTAEIRLLVARIRCVAAAFPEREYPVFTDDDWRLLLQDLAYGKSSFKEITDTVLLRAVRDYAGSMCMAELDRLTPVSVKLPSGRTGKISYPDGAPPELRARIGDFIGWKGAFSVCGGRVKGVFDILAPNWRTAQKTADLDGFWGGSYLEIKKELKRRYPKHPWP